MTLSQAPAFAPLFSKNRLLLLIQLLICLVNYPVLAQSVEKVALTGKVIDNQTTSPLSFASVRLFRSADSTLVNGSVTDEKGAFLIEVATGTYYIQVEFIGYKPHFSKPIQVANANLNLGTVKLSPSASTLDELVVQAEKSSMELSLDKKIFNVGKDLANAGGTAIDILNNVPSVSVDVEGNVSLRGSGNVRILIDGKPSGLVSFKGGSGLQQLQGTMIDKVEVITNPSARYEAEGNGGIINIVLKKERKEGFNGSFDLVAGNPTNFGAAANVNYRKKNVNFFVNYSMSYRNAPGRNSLYQEVYRNDSTFVSTKDMESKLKGMYNNARAGIDYFLNPRNTLTASYTYRISKGKRFSDIKFHDYLSSLNSLQSITYRTQDETETEPNSEYALNYKKTFERKGQELLATVQYIDNWEDSDQYFNEKTVNPDGSATSIKPILQRAVNFETEKQLLGQIDYVHPFAKEGKLEAGIRSSFRDMTNDYTVTQRNDDGSWFKLPGLTNDFLYEENIQGAYGIVGNKMKRFSYQVGVRAEWTNVTTTLRNTNEVNQQKYNNIFPSVHVSYDLPQQNALQLSYSRRVRRPKYNDLSPFMTFSDNRNYWSGNPELRPEFTDSYEVGHIKHLEQGSITSSVYYRYTTGKIDMIRRVDELGNAVSRPENLATENAFGAELTSNYTPLPWWKLDGSVNFFRSIIDGTNVDRSFESDTYSWLARARSKFTLLKNTDFQLRGNYEAPRLTPQGKRKAIATLDFAVSKDILNNNGTLTLNVIDVFNSRRYRSITEGPSFYSSSSSQGQLRQINLIFNYRLHQAKAKKKDGDQGDF
jgi:ferric enterobactin receptor